ncbi:MAG: right-handed parallel beta-helix repeat-containing protein, partial [Planctomycetaceae bacterium]
MSYTKQFPAWFIRAHRAWLLAAVALIPISGFAQNPDPDRDPASGVITGNGIALSGAERLGQQANDGVGWLFRLGHLTGPGVGRTESINPIELMPYLIEDDSILFADFRLFRNNGGQLNVGGNMGVGAKKYFAEINRTIGASFFYGRDDLSDVTFEEVSVGAQILGQNWDAHGNIYIPVGEQIGLARTDLLSETARFSGNNILYDQRRIIASAMKGFDVELAVPIWGEFAEKHNIKVGAGAYYFESSGVADVVGWRGRLQGELFPGVSVRTEITSDDTFDTNVIFGVNWEYGGLDRSKRRGRRIDQRYRLTEPVQRKYHIVVNKTPVIDEGLVAINPATGNSYSIYHVSNAFISPVQTGTLTEPFETLQQAQTASQLDPVDILFVHANSSYTAIPDNSVLLNPGDVALGEGDGVNHFIDIVGFNNPLTLPRATASGSRPVFQGAAADGVTMASNSEFSGFRVEDAVGNGISLPGVTEVFVRNTQVVNAGLDGIVLQSVSGTATFEDTEVLGASGVGFHITGGAPAVNFRSIPDQPGIGHISNASDHAIRIENMIGGYVNMTSSFVTDDGGQGIRIQDSNGNITIDNADLSNSSTTGIDIQRGTGTYTFRNSENAATLIDNPADHGVNIGGSNAKITFSGLTVTGRNTTGINVGVDSTTTSLFTGQLRFNEGVLIDTPTAGTDPALLFDNATGSAQFDKSLSINGGGGTGITIGGTMSTIDPTLPVTSGSFVVKGNTTIDGTTDDGILIFNTRSNVGFDGLDIQNRIARGIHIHDVVETLDGSGNPVVDFSGDPTSANLAFSGISIISNAGASTASAIDIHNNSSTISFGSVFVTDATGNPGVNIIDNPNAGLTARSVDFSDLNITSDAGVGLFASNNPDMVLGIAGGNITTTANTAVHLETTGTDVSLTSVTATGAAGATSGINLLEITNPRNQIYNFAVLGDGTSLANGSGGTISDFTAVTQQGALIRNAGSVLLRGMNFDQNRTHIESLTTAANPNASQTVHLQFVQATASTDVGVDFVDTHSVEILDSLFSGNGNAGFGSIRMRILTQGTYDWAVARTNITDSTGVAIEIGPDTVSGSTLNLSLVDNLITNTRAGDQTVLLNWNGDLTANILRNQILSSGGSTVLGVIDLNTQSI